MDDTTRGMREALAIELHDASVILIAEDTFPGRSGWADKFWSTGTSYRIEGEMLGRFLRFLDIHPQRVRQFDRERQRDEELRIEDDDFEVKQDRHFVEIDSLQARIDGPHLLSLSVEVTLHDTPGTFVRELTYSGTYTVWWK